MLRIERDPFSVFISTRCHSLNVTGGGLDDGLFRRRKKLAPASLSTIATEQPADISTGSDDTPALSIPLDTSATRRLWCRLYETVVQQCAACHRSHG